LMELQTEAPVAADVTATPTDEPKNLSTREAAQLLRSLRDKKKEAPAPDPVEAAPEPESPPQEGDSDPQPDEVEATAETQEAEPTPDESPLGPPRSWSKEQHEYWNSLPRATQEYLLARDKENSTAVRKAQNEAAEFRKAVEAERQQLAQVRQYHEYQVNQALQLLQSTGEFADIQTQADVDRLAETDWPRYIKWDAHQKKVQSLQQQQAYLNQQREWEHSNAWKQWSEEQDLAFREAVPEIADSEKGKRLMEGSIKTLEEAGFNKQELAAWWNGQPMSMRDARWQQIMLKAAKWDESQAKLKQAPKKQLPAPQRPGVSQGSNHAAEQRVKDLTAKLAKTGDMRVAAELMKAKRAASS
jgi:hypothetical protein